MNVGYIYCYKNVLSNKVYTGQTYDINRRITEHKSKALRGYKEKFYNSVKEAALYNNISTSQMSRLCSGKRNSTTDQIWRYK